MSLPSSSPHTVRGAAEPNRPVYAGTAPKSNNESNNMTDDLERWAPPGADKFYQLEIKLDGQAPIQLSALVPDADTSDFAGARLQRIGGATKRDEEFRAELYYYVGKATVAGGHIESAMKRLLILATGEREHQFARVDENWSTLEKRLRSAARTFGDRGRAITEAIEWAAVHNIKKTPTSSLDLSNSSPLIAKNLNIIATCLTV